MLKKEKETVIFLQSSKRSPVPPEVASFHVCDREVKAAGGHPELRGHDVRDGLGNRLVLGAANGADRQQVSEGRGCLAAAEGEGDIGAERDQDVALRLARGGGDRGGEGLEGVGVVEAVARDCWGTRSKEKREREREISAPSPGLACFVLQINRNSSSAARENARISTVLGTAYRS